MKIVMANDTGAFSLKNKVKRHLSDRGIDILDLGTSSPGETMTYVEAGIAGAKAVQDAAADRGILFCGSGAGVMLAAGKHKGIRAVVSESRYTAEQARMINDCNILCMGANVVDEDTAVEMADVFVDTDFAAGTDEIKKSRLKKFADQIKKIENRNFKRSFTNEVRKR